MNTSKTNQKETFRNKYKFFIQFFTLLFSVLLAFQLDSCKRQNEANENTYIKINLMYIEMGENVSKADLTIKMYSDTSLGNLRYSSMHSLSTLAVLQDENVFNILEPEHIYLIRAYLNSVQSLNYMNEKYVDYFLSKPIREISTVQRVREKVLDHAASIIAIYDIFEKESGSYWEKLDINNTKLNNLQERLQKEKEDILKGRYNLLKSF